MLAGRGGGHTWLFLQAYESALLFMTARTCAIVEEACASRTRSSDLGSVCALCFIHSFLDSIHSSIFNRKYCAKKFSIQLKTQYRVHVFN